MHFQRHATHGFYAFAKLPEFMLTFAKEEKGACVDAYFFEGELPLAFSSRPQGLLEGVEVLQKRTHEVVSVEARKTGTFVGGHGDGVYHDALKGQQKNVGAVIHARENLVYAVAVP